VQNWLGAVKDRGQPDFDARLQRTPLWPGVFLVCFTLLVLSVLQALFGGY
jgi:hypothetical protein